MILLTGATGTIGANVVRQLQATGARFRIFARNPEKAAAIAGPDVDIVQGDLTDTAALQIALKGAEHLFLLTPSGPQQTELEKGIVDTASKAGVGHIVRISVLGASPFSPIRINQWHWLCEKYIEKSGVPFTALRPGFFMQNTLMFAATASSQGKIFAPGAEARVSMIDARDIAAVAVACLTEEGHIYRAYDLTGPEAVSMNEVAGAIGNAIGREVEYVNVPPETARQGMLASGAPEWLADDLLTYWEYFRAGYGDVVTPVVERIKGCPAISYEQFAKDYAEAFSSSAQADY